MPYFLLASNRLAIFFSHNLVTYDREHILVISSITMTKDTFDTLNEDYDRNCNIYYKY